MKRVTERPTTYLYLPTYLRLPTHKYARPSVSFAAPSAQAESRVLAGWRISRRAPFSNDLRCEWRRVASPAAASSSASFVKRKHDIRLSAYFGVAVSRRRSPIPRSDTSVRLLFEQLISRLARPLRPSRRPSTRQPRGVSRCHQVPSLRAYVCRRAPPPPRPAARQNAAVDAAAAPEFVAQRRALLAPRMRTRAARRAWSAPDHIRAADHSDYAESKFAQRNRRSPPPRPSNQSISSGARRVEQANGRVPHERLEYNLESKGSDE